MMAISKSLRTRAITGILFVVVVLLMILANSWTFLALLSIILWLCMFEWGFMYGVARNVFHPILASIGTLLFLYLCLKQTDVLIPVILLILFILLIINLFSAKLLKHSFVVLTSSLAYFIIPSYLAYDLSMNRGNYDYSWVLFPLLLIWVNDVFAYVTGSLIGKHKMIPWISPNKTWEGTLGGIILCSIASILVGSQLGLNTSQSVILGLGIGIFSTLGDLFESSIKRTFGVKDSGSILPGHGGFMDRFDSFMMVMPYVWIFKTYIL